MDNEPQREYNPNRDEVSGKQGVVPDFLQGLGGGEETKDAARSDRLDKRAQKASGAASMLKGAEGAATATGINPVGQGLNGVRQSEAASGGFFSGKGRPSTKKIKGKGKIKKAGPVAGVLSLLLLVGATLSGAQLFQPFSLVANFMVAYNSMHTSANMRSRTFFYKQMSTKEVKNPIGATIFGNEKFVISKKQAAELERQGIKYNDSYEFEGKKYKVLEYDNGAGQKRVVTADSDLAARMRASGRPAISFMSAYANDASFFQKYNAGSMTWRGQIANWFGKTTSTFLKNNNLSRNVFSDYKKKVKEARTRIAAEGGDTKNAEKEATQEILEKRTGTLDDGGIKRSQMETDNDEKASGGDASKTRTNRANINVNDKLNNIKTKMQGGANVACAVVDTIGAVSLLVTAAEALQIINLTMSFFETVDKTKDGLGDEAPINVFAEALNTRKESKNVVFVDAAPGTGIKVDNETIDLATETKVSNKTPVEAAGIAALFEGGKVNPNDPSVQSFNLTSSANRIMGGIGTSMAAFSGCLAAKAVTAGASLVVDAVGTLSCVATVWAGGGACWGLLVNIGIGIAASVAIGSIIAGVISLITPWAESALTRDLVTDLGGEDLGNALASGGNMYLGNIHKANGGSLATQDKYTQFAYEQQKVMAENAKVERASLSPFDITSENTFMGSIMTKIMGFATTDSLMDILTTNNSIISSSLIALSPTTTAYDIAEDLYTDEEYEKICPYLASIGAVGDAFCNPYTITDTSTINEDPDDVVTNVYNIDPRNFSGTDSDGNVKINGESDLAKYIIFCNNRTSMFGIPDQNIISEIQGWTVSTGNSAIDTAANSALGAVPVIGDLIDIGQDVNSQQNIGYISGESCVAGNSLDTNFASESPGWDEAKEYQRFIEDQSLMESSGIIEKSAVSALLDEYYEQNPLDNSYEGIIARYSGLDKDLVADILDLIEYYDYIANYDASERYAFGGSNIEEDKELLFDNENELACSGVLLETIVYADVRNRNFVV